MNAHPPPAKSPLALLRTLARHRQLLWALCRREVSSRYQGSAAGVAWSLLQPLLMLTMYCFVFALILPSRWPEPEGGSADFALLMFAGMLPFALLSDVLNRAPTLMSSQRHFVKRVVFPLELLPIASAVGVLVHVLLQTLIWLCACALLHKLHWGLAWAPLLLLPLFLLALGLGWLLAAMSVFLRDLVHLVPIISSALIFLAPVFYPASAVPAPWQAIVSYNPISLVIEQLRSTALGGVAPDPVRWAGYCTMAIALGWLGFACFQALKRDIADEL